MLRQPLGRHFFTLAMAAGILTALPVKQASACGGFFCSQSLPVNQAAERIVFAQNQDDTVTAVIQIMYEGPSESFSWLLPISSVPDADEIAVSSDVAFQRLQNFTNPTYNLTTRVEGTCRTDEFASDGFPQAGGVATSGATGGSLGGEGVMVEASGVVGSFEWTVISFDPALDDPADAAVTWLEENEYDVTPAGAELIGPYLADGMYLLALKLVKGANAGAIRPIVLTYDAGEPMIPIKLTAVAANDNMGVMTWLLGDARAVPKNYLSLELNEAQINWFNAAATYDDVVTAAAKEASGQGFVTEFAGEASSLSEVIWSQSDESTWTNLTGGGFSSLREIMDTTTSLYSGWDGYWDAVRTTVTLPQGVSVDDLQVCYGCYADQLEFTPSEFLAAVEEHVIDPVRLMQDLFDSQAYATRLYTTMSASDMTTDPAFTFNGDLKDVSNIHTAERIIECSPDLFQSEAPWRIELPQGGVIRGTAAEANGRSWPTAVQEHPANLTIRQLSASGPGRIVNDNSETVSELLEQYNASLEMPGGNGAGGQGPAGGTGGGPNSDPAGADSTSTPAAPTRASGGGGCSVGVVSGTQPWSYAFGLLALGWVKKRRRSLKSRRTA